MKIEKLRLCASRTAMVLAICAATPAIAQDETAAADEAVDPTEIVVTAQKRSESVQKVPISIAAFNGAALEKANVATILDLGRIATNFQTVRSSNTGSTRIGIRGVGSLANTLIEPSVAVFLDGVYVPRSGSILGSFLDMEGVEVLRGPQGTLFGRNASVGALSLKSALPRNEFSGEVAAEAGSFNRYKLSGNVNVPLGENVAMRLAGMGQWYKGPWHNRFDGKTYGGSDDVSLRGTIKADLGNVEWIVRGDYTKLDGDGVTNFDFDPTSVSPGAVGRPSRRLFNGGPDTNLNDREMNQFVASGLVDKNWGVSSTASLDIGGSTLKLINSYRVWTNDQLDGDIIFMPVSLASRRSLFDSKSQNHELQFISPEKEWLGGKFDMVAGLYYFSEDFALSEELNLGANYCSFIIAPVWSRPWHRVRHLSRHDRRHRRRRSGRVPERQELRRLRAGQSAPFRAADTHSRRSLDQRQEERHLFAGLGRLCRCRTTARTRSADLSRHQGKPLHLSRQPQLQADRRCVAVCQPFDRIQVGGLQLGRGQCVVVGLRRLAACWFRPSACSIARPSRTMSWASSRAGSTARSSSI